LNQTTLRRCAFLHLEPVEELMFDPVRLLHGEDGLVPRIEWRALAPHLSAPVTLDEAEVAALGHLSDSAWKPRAELEAALGAGCVASLIAKGLLIERGDDASPDTPQTRDQRLRDTHWHPGAAIMHAFSRWSGTDADAVRRKAQPDALKIMVERFGAPPPHFFSRADARARVQLEAPQRTGLDELLARRATCRNFDPARAMTKKQLSALLKRVFGVQATEELAPGAVALKKNHPSGGALHPIEAYLVVQRVEALAGGLYHYNVEAHALDLLREMDAQQARAFALDSVAGQDFFAAAPAMVMMVARFARSQWKYRKHPKVYRAILLEAGHISQNLYLTATEMDLGAFITAAINEVEIEQAFGLDAMAEGPLCVCGFGPRAREKVTAELDPLHKVWGA
jgi:putative peptide maturation dehydrogenase